MAPSRIRLSLVLPAYNEEPGIALAVREAHAALTALGYDFEVIVVDDGSRDATADRVREVAAELDRVLLVRHDGNKGYGAALRTGFEEASKDLVAFSDSDAQFFLEDLDRLVPLTRTHHVAAGFRVDRQDPWRRRFYSWGYNMLVRRMIGTGVRDCDCALKVYRREALVDLMPESRGFFVNAEMLSKARRLGYRVAEAGVRHRPRVHGSSKVTLVDVPKTLRRLVPYWWQHVAFRRSAPPLPVVDAPAVGASVPKPTGRAVEMAAVRT